MKEEKVYDRVYCLTCGREFSLTRKDRKYCSDTCRKKSSARNLAKVVSRDRGRENFFASRDHYERAAWLTYDLYRMPEAARTLMIQRLLEAASGDNANIRRILLDPKLLSPNKDHRAGRFKHDRKIGVSNIAKQVYQFCMTNYSCSTKDCILDDGEPAGRKFVGDPVVEKPYTAESCEPSEKHITILKRLSGASRQAYHAMLVVEFKQKLNEVKLAA